jgi:diguanylate cyclase (GGDEF)-like protein
MFSLEPGNLLEMLERLDLARRDHAAWQDALIGTLLCRVPSDPNDLAEDSHRRCRFGKWYYGELSTQLRAQPEFAAIESEHKITHAVAAKLLRVTATGATITRADYDDFVASGARLRLELDTLRNEIQAALRGIDPLTGAYGRAALLPELRMSHELVKRGVQQCCIAFMDLDRFKQVNDTYGHSVGDQVLAGAVRCLGEHLRPYDKVFRYGGDEFLIVLPAADLAGGHRVTERIRKKLTTTPLVSGVEGVSICANASFGLAMLDSQVSVQESIDRADTALLLAKSSGRNRTVSWNPSIQTHRALRALTDSESAA